MGKDSHHDIPRLSQTQEYRPMTNHIRGEERGSVLVR